VIIANPVPARPVDPGLRRECQNGIADIYLKGGSEGAVGRAIK
jgi:hypothetical protein